MGKKKNKKKGGDFWDIATSKDQMKNLDIIAQIEKCHEKGNKKVGKAGDIFGLSSTPITDENGLPAGLVDVISRDMGFKERDEEEIGHPLGEIASMIEHSVTSKPVDTSLERFEKECQFEPERPDPKKLKGVEFNVIEELGRLTVSDAIVPVSLYIPTIFNTIELMDGSMDADQLGDDMSLIFHYIISCKHPTAIFTPEEFFGFMKDVESYNDAKYIFMSLEDELILAYKVEGREEANDYLFSTMHYAPEDVLKCFVSLAYMAGTVHSAFFVEESDYIEAFVNSKYNLIEEFVEDFKSDEETIIDEKDDEKVDVIDVRELQTAARQRISTLVGEEDMFDDEDDYEEENTEESWVCQNVEIVEVSEEDDIEENVEIVEVTGEEDLLAEVDTTVEEATKVDVIRPTEEKMVVTVRTGKKTPESQG